MHKFFTWNNHLLSVSVSGSNTAYEYDGDGTRISKTQNSVKIKYINDVALGLVQVLMETNNAGIIQASCTYGQGLISMDKAGENSYYHYDGLGSVKQLTDSGGIVTANYTYDSFGNSVGSVPSVANPYGFTGEQQFGEADGLVFLRARYYKPSIGRFISRDPILTPIKVKRSIGWFLPYPFLLSRPQYQHPYVYVHNNPVNLVDLLGLTPATAQEVCYYGVFVPCMAAMGGKSNPNALKICGEAEAACWIALVYEGKNACDAIKDGLDYIPKRPGNSVDWIVVMAILTLGIFVSIKYRRPVSSESN